MFQKAFESFKNIVIGKYFCFDGRAGRAEFWLFSAGFWSVSFVIGLLPWIGGFLAGLWSLALLLPLLGVTVRRLHDRGFSGWFVLISLIPYIGSIALMVLLVQDGSRGDNLFGKEPEKFGEPFDSELFLKRMMIIAIAACALTGLWRSIPSGSSKDASAQTKASAQLSAQAEARAKIAEAQARIAEAQAKAAIARAEAVEAAGREAGAAEEPAPGIKEVSAASLNPERTGKTVSEVRKPSRKPATPAFDQNAIYRGDSKDAKDIVCWRRGDKFYSDAARKNCLFSKEGTYVTKDGKTLFRMMGEQLYKGDSIAKKDCLMSIIDLKNRNGALVDGEIYRGYAKIHQHEEQREPGGVTVITDYTMTRDGSHPIKLKPLYTIRGGKVYKGKSSAPEDCVLSFYGDNLHVARVLLAVYFFAGK